MSSAMNSTPVNQSAILNHMQHGAAAANHVLSGSSVGECYDAEERDGDDDMRMPIDDRNEPAFRSVVLASSSANDSAADEQEEEARKLKLLEDDLVEAGDSVDDDVHYTFPFILHKMLERVEEAGLGHIVSWQPCGACFRVHQPHKFTDKVMGKFFKAQTKFKSFQRQLHMYSFQRILQGKDKGAYEHKMFQRVSPKLCLKMKRLPKKMRSKQKQQQQQQKEGTTTAPPLKTKKGKEERGGARCGPKRPAAFPGKFNVSNRAFLGCGKIDPKAAGSSPVTSPSQCYPPKMAGNGTSSREENKAERRGIANDHEHGTSAAASAPACGSRQSRSPKTMVEVTGPHFPDFYPLLKNGCFSAFATAADHPLPMKITAAADDDDDAGSRGIDDSSVTPSSATSASTPQKHRSLLRTNPPLSSMDMVMAGNASRSAATQKTAMRTLLRGKQHMDQQNVGLGREADSSMMWWRSTSNSSVIPQDSLLSMQEEAIFNTSSFAESQPAPHQHRHHAGSDRASAPVGIGGEEGIGGGVSRQLKQLLEGAASSVPSHRFGETTVATMPPPADQMINDCLAFLRSRKLAPPPPTANAAKNASEKKDARGWASTGVEATNATLLFGGSRDHHEDEFWCMDDPESMDQHADTGDERQGSVVSEEGEITGPHNDDQNRTTMALFDIFEQRQSFPMMLTSSMQQRKEQEDASPRSATTRMQLELSAYSRYEEPTRAPTIRVPAPTATYGSRHEITGDPPCDYGKASPGVAAVLASPTSCAKQSSISTIVSDHILSQRCVGRNLQHHGQSYHHPQRHGTQELQIISAQTNLMTGLSSSSNDGADLSAWPCFHAKYPDFFEGKPFFPIEEEAS